MTCRIVCNRPRSASLEANRLRWLFLLIGAIALSYSGYVYLDTRMYQAYEESSFDREVTAMALDRAASGGAKPDPQLIGRIEIPRLRVRAIVKEGADDRTLRRAVGHVPGTARPGSPGNVALAGHRDTFFRGLRNVRKNDRIVLETLGGTYEYAVESMKIVRPKDVQVLAPTKEPVLTLVTCYPFNFIGSAPKRYIVRARQVAALVSGPSSPRPLPGLNH